MPNRSGGVPLIDFSPIGRLGEVYSQGKIMAARQQLGQAFKDGKIDYGTGAKILAEAGDMEGAMTFAKLGESAGYRAQDQAWRQQEADRAQSNADRSFAASRQEHEDAMTRPQIVGSPDTGYYAIDRRGNPVGQQAAQPSMATPVAGGTQPQPATPAVMQPIIPPRVKQLTEVEKALPGEMAARIALGDKFLDEYPLLRSQIASGAVTGMNAPAAYFNSGTQGEIARKIKSGTDALLRNLTGAGMPLEEAKKYVSRYEPGPLDKSGTVISKIDQLQDELRRVEDEAYRGRGGTPKAKLDNRAAIKWASDQIDKGAPRENVMRALRSRGVTFMEGSNPVQADPQTPAYGPAAAAPAAAQAAPFNFTKQQVLDEARAAFGRKAATPEAKQRVMQKLREMGIDPAELN